MVVDFLNIILIVSANFNSPLEDVCQLDELEKPKFEQQLTVNTLEVD